MPYNKKKTLFSFTEIRIFMQMGAPPLVDPDPHLKNKFTDPNLSFSKWFGSVFAKMDWT